MEKEKELGDDDGMGIEDFLALNPPILEGHDEFVWDWFNDNVSGFARDFNMMPQLIEGLGLDRWEMTLFMMKLNEIYKHKQRLAEKIMKPRGDDNA